MSSLGFTLQTLVIKDLQIPAIWCLHSLEQSPFGREFGFQCSKPSWLGGMAHGVHTELHFPPHITVVTGAIGLLTPG